MGCLVQHVGQLIIYWWAVFLFILFLLLLFSANMWFNQMKTNLANSIKFICTFFKSTLNTNFPSPILCLRYGINIRWSYSWSPNLFRKREKKKNWWKHSCVKTYCLERESTNNTIIFLSHWKKCQFSWRWHDINIFPRSHENILHAKCILIGMFLDIKTWKTPL